MVQIKTPGLKMAIPGAAPLMLPEIPRIQKMQLLLTIAEQEQMQMQMQGPALVLPGLRYKAEMIHGHKQFVRQPIVLQMPADHMLLQQQEVLITKAGQQNKARITRQVTTNREL